MIVGVIMIALFMLIFLSIHSVHPVHIYAVDPLTEVLVSPTSIGTNETAEIRVNVINDKPKSPPELSATSDKFTIRYRGSSTQRQVNIINGTMENRLIYTYIYELTPKEVGTFTVPTFAITTSRGKKIFSKSSQITIQNIGTTRPQGLRQRGNNPFHSMFGEPLEAFLQMRADSDRIPQNTGAIVELYLFSNDPNFLTGLNQLQQIQRVQFEGGVVHEVPFEENNDIITEQFGYDVFYGKLIKKFLIFPMEKGDLSIRPPAYQSQQRRINVLGELLEISSYPLTDSLTYIGNNVDLSHKLSKTSVPVSEELNLSLSIEGDGNVDFFVSPFNSTSLTNVFIAAPETSLELGFINNDSNRLFMRKTFNYTVIPKVAGTVNLPSFSLNFATKNGRLTNMTYPAISFEVTESTTKKSTDTGFTPKTNVSPTIYYGSGTIITIISILLGTIMMLASFLYAREQTRLSTDVNYARSSGAKKRLQKILSESEQAIKNNHYKDASRLIRQSILYFCADKFLLSNSSSPQEIIDYLNQKNIDFPTKNGFLQLMSDLDFHAFASSPSETQIKAYLSEAYQFLDEFDKIKIK